MYLEQYLLCVTSLRINETFYARPLKDNVDLSQGEIEVPCTCMDVQ